MKFIILVVAVLMPCVAFAQVDKEKLLGFYQAQRYGEAASYLSEVYATGTTDPAALNQMAYCYLMAGNLPKAAVYYHQLDSLQPGRLPVLFSLAGIYSRRGSQVRARDYLNRVLRIDSLNFRAIRQLAELADSLPEKHIYLEKANRIDPADADVAADLARSYRIRQLPQRAYTVLKAAIEADTGNLILQRDMLPVANQLKKYREVLAYGDRILREGPDAMVCAELGKASYALGEYRPALTYFERSAALERPGESVLYYMTRCYMELKNHRLAAVYAQKTIEEGISPNISSYYAMLGSIYETSGQNSSAGKAYKKGLTFRQTGDLYYRLAVLYDGKLKSRAAAAGYYRQFLNSRPNPKTDAPQIDYARHRLKALTGK